MSGFWDIPNSMASYASSVGGDIGSAISGSSNGSGAATASSSDPLVAQIANGLIAKNWDPATAQAMAEAMVGSGKSNSSSSSSSSGSSTGSVNQTTPSLAQIIYAASQASGTGYAATGFLPNWVLPAAQSETQTGYRTLDKKRYTVKSSDALLVYLGNAPDKHHKVVETTTGGGARKMGGPAEDPSGTTVTKTKDGGDKVVTAQQAANLPYSWDSTKVTDTIKQMQAAGLRVTDFNSMMSAWGALVDRAANTYTLSGGQTKMTPWDALDMYKQENPNASLPASDPRSPIFTGDKTHVSRSVTSITEGEAWTSLQSSLSQMLGRDPSSQELRDFVYRMNNLASRNPSVTKTIQGYKDGQPVGPTTSHTNPGFTSSDVAMQAYDTAQNNPDYAEYQAATTYFNALQSALSPIGG